METYHACLECRASLDGKRAGTRGPRQFCDKSCAQSYRNRIRATRTMTPPPPVDGARWIALTQGKFALVDEADFADVSRWNWCAVQKRSKANDLYAWYAFRGRTPEDVGGKTTPVLLHRHLLGEPPEDVDHRNRDGLDNRRENLRKATAQQNMMNSLSRGGSSRFKGASWSRGQWRASIRLNYKTVHLGRFNTEEDAARAYDEAARRLHGEFARVNFPRDGERSALHD
jgi:hypothetical protein